MDVQKQMRERFQLHSVSWSAGIGKRKKNKKRILFLNASFLDQVGRNSNGSRHPAQQEFAVTLSCHRGLE